MWELEPGEKKGLLLIARETLQTYFLEKKRAKIPPRNDRLREPGGAFVTLTIQGQLRGCIGHLGFTSPLCEVVSQCAIAAAVEDLRFSPLTKDDLDLVEIEISVLSPMQDVRSIEEITVGTHGLLIASGGSRGLLLPQVASKYGWDRLTFLQETCRKAGLPRDAWQKGARIQVFTAQVFSETEPG
jgi:AmmeMemoRadiSam system protein A